MTSRAVWFLDNKIKVFPIKSPDGKNIKGKEPDCRSWDDYVCGRSVAAKFKNYGVVLGLLAVVDSDTPETEQWVVDHAPVTPFVVNTGRGKHRYYRLIHDAPHYIHRDNHTIEIRHRGQYVVGPGSVHSSGTIYTPNDWSWNITDIPIFPVKDFIFDDRSPDQRGGDTSLGTPFILPPQIRAGERHDMMFKLMRSLQARGINDVEQLIKLCHTENILKCSPPIDINELTTYIRRVSRHPDRKGFVKYEIIDLNLALNLTDVGLDNSTIIKASGVNPLATTDLTLADIDLLIPGVASFDEPPDDKDFVPSVAIFYDRNSKTALHSLASTTASSLVTSPSIFTPYCTKCNGTSVIQDKDQEHPGVGICAACGPCYIDDRVSTTFESHLASAVKITEASPRSTKLHHPQPKMEFFCLECKKAKIIRKGWTHCVGCGSMEIGEREKVKRTLTLEQQLERAEQQLAELQALNDPNIETIEIEDDPNIETIEVSDEEYAFLFGDETTNDETDDSTDDDETDDDESDQ